MSDHDSKDLREPDDEERPVERALVELAQRGFLECITAPRCGNCTTCRAYAIACDVMAAEGAE